MASLVPLNPPRTQPDLHDTAIDNLRFIRGTSVKIVPSMDITIVFGVLIGRRHGG